MRLRLRSAASLVTALIAAATTLGCTTRNPDICCDTANQCIHAGLDPTSGLAPCADGVCVNYTCVATGCDDDLDCHDAAHPSCVSGQCYGAVDACRAGGGSRIIFVSTREDGPGLYSMYVNGQGQRRISDSVLPGTDQKFASNFTGNVFTYEDAYMSMSPDESAVAFIGAGTMGIPSVFIVNADGSGLRQVSDGVEAIDHVEWSPDGQKLAISTRYDGVSASASVMRVDGTHKLPLSADGPEYEPSWSPDSTKIVYAARSGSQDIRLWVSNDNATSPIIFEEISDAGVRYGPMDYELFQPKWASDNSAIAFVILEDVLGPTIALKPMNGGSVILVDGAVGDDQEVSWSHDATRLTFMRNRNIWTMNADGTGQRMLTVGSVSFHPRWSLDDQKILFDSNRDGNREIYEMNADGSNQVNLTNFPGPDDALSHDFGAEWATCPNE